MSDQTESLATSAERNVLGGIMLSCETLPPGLELLRPGDFVSPLHAIVFAAMLTLHAQHEPIDMVTVHGAVKNGGSDPRQGWPTFLAELTDATVTSANVEHYASIVKREARRRDAVAVFTRALHAARQEGADGDDVIIDAVTQLGILAAGREITRPVLMREVVSAEITAIGVRGTDLIPPGLPTGLAPLDNLLGGLCPGNLVIIASRPAMGKSSLALNIVTHVVTRRCKAVLLFSFEMTREEQAQRALAAEARTDFSRILVGKPNPDEWDRLTVAANTLHNDRFHIVDGAPVTIAEMRSIARAHAASHQLDLIVVDYLQQVVGTGDNREQEVSSISRGLKALAMELRIPVLAMAQLSRAVEGRSDKRPTLSDLRESGSLEQDANKVMFIYRDDYYHPDSDEPGVAEIGIAKNRNGPTGMVKLRWTGRHTRFDSLEDEDQHLPLAAHHNQEESHAELV